MDTIRADDTSPVVSAVPDVSSTRLGQLSATDLLARLRPEQRDGEQPRVPVAAFNASL